MGNELFQNMKHHPFTAQTIDSSCYSCTSSIWTTSQTDPHSFSNQTAEIKFCIFQ
jgi:hypothetical protein